MGKYVKSDPAIHQVGDACMIYSTPTLLLYLASTSIQTGADKPGERGSRALEDNVELTTCEPQATS